MTTPPREQAEPAEPAGAAEPAALTRYQWFRFARHYGEMVIAMFIGMFVLGALLDMAGLGFSRADDPDLGYLVMATNMSAGMAVLMRVRRHGWGATLEMCAVMYAPAVPLFPLLWSGVIGGMALMVLAHVAMFPLMLAVMLRRRREYAGCVT